MLLSLLNPVKESEQDGTSSPTTALYLSFPLVRLHSLAYIGSIAFSPLWLLD